MVTIGIDNGISGALAAYNSETSEVEVVVMPIVSVKTAKGNKNQYDIPAIVAWFRQKMSMDVTLNPHLKMVVLEKAQPFPGQGAVSMFSIGRGFGTMEGILVALGLPFVVIHPKTWQKKMFEGMPHADTKQASIMTAQRLFPNTQFIATPASSKLHNGMTDAVLMAVYGSRL